MTWDGVELVKTYGPLALGWVMYIWERNDKNELQKSLTTMVIAQTSALVEFKGVLQQILMREAPK